MTENNTTNLISKFSNLFSAEKAEGVDEVIQLHLSGESGGDWYLQIKNKECNLVQGIAEAPGFTLESSITDFKDLAEGKLEPVKAFMSGRIKFSGNMMVAMKLASLFKNNQG